MDISIDTSELTLQENPEKKLLYALLRRAVLDFLGNDAPLKEEAERWFHAKQNPLDPEGYSFLWVCGQLSIEPSLFLKRLRGVAQMGNGVLVSSGELN